MFVKCKEILSTLQVSISFHEILELIPKFSKFMKELLKGTKHKVVKEQVNMTEKDEMEVPQTLPPKIKNLSKFTISCNIGGLKILHACRYREKLTGLTQIATEFYLFLQKQERKNSQ